MSNNITKNNYKKLGEAVVKAIANYAGINYTPNVDSNYYIVKKGDNLWSIASKNNTTVDNIKRLNNLTSNNLYIGKTLKISDNDNNSNLENKNIYTVKKGDSLWLIASKNKVSVDDIKSANNLTSNILQIGQTLIIPDKKPSTKEITYVVKKGDSLWLIANKYDTTVEKIKSANNLTSNTLRIGQVLTIPSSSEFFTYTVKNGDSLWLIAKNYNTTVDNIKKLNNLTSNTLQINQKLILPS